MTRTPQREQTAGIIFTCHAPGGRAVFLAGTFNGWEARATPMTKDADGNWSVSLDVPPGRHEFKFVVDGDWCCEPGCHGSAECPECAPNDFGTMNRVIEVA